MVWIPHDTSAGLATGITAALAVRDPSERLIGVVTVNFARSDIAGFLRSIKIGEHGSVVLFGSDGELLAGTPGPGLEAAALTVARWGREPNSPRADQKARRMEIQVDGAKWNIVARSIPLEAGPSWIVVAALPDSDFMGPVYANRRAALAIMAIGTAIAVGAGVALSAAIARSLGGATRALHGIAKFELKQPPRRRSMLREVAQLEDAVARATASLRSFTRYAPEEIVRDVAASGQEAMLSGQNREVTVLFSDLRGFTASRRDFRRRTWSPSSTITSTCSSASSRDTAASWSISWATRSSPSSVRSVPTRITPSAPWRARSRLSARGRRGTRRTGRAGGRRWRWEPRSARVRRSSATWDRCAGSSTAS